MRKRFIGVALASAIVFGGGITNVYADNDTSVINKTPDITNDIPVSGEIEKQGMSTQVNKIAEEDMIDFLYVVDKDNYRNAIGKDTALFIIKDRMLIVDSEQLSDDDLFKIDSAKEFYILGELDGELKNLKNKENFKANLLGQDRVTESIKHAEENGADKSMIIANVNSSVDSLTAIQMSKIKGKNFILIEDELSDEVKDFIKANGKDREIEFISGEVTIDEKTQKEILKLAGNVRYEINTNDFIKAGFIRQLKEDEVSIDKEINKVTDSNSLIANLSPQMKDSIENAAKRSVEEGQDILISQERIISLEAIEDEVDDVSQVVLNKSVEVIENDKKKTEGIIKIAEQEKEASAHQLTITKNTPIDSEKLEEVESYYIVPAKVNDKVIEKVFNGEYGNGAERVTRLAQDGYDYDEVQGEVERAVREQAEAQATANTQAHVNNVQVNNGNAQTSAGTQASTQTQANTVNNASSNPAPAVKIETKTKTTPPASSANASGSVESFISSLTTMQGWEYSQSKRMQQGYADCSSIILLAMLKSGVTSDTTNLTTVSIASDSRFYEVPMSQIKRGDILWSPGHTEVFLGGNSTFGAFKPGKPAGYSSGTNRFSKAYRISGF